VTKLVVAIALSCWACTSNSTPYTEVGVQVSDLSRAQVLVDHYNATVLFPASHACSVLDNASVTFGGMPAHVEPGGILNDGKEDIGCTPPKLVYDADLSAMTGATTPLELVVSDSSGQASATTVGLYAPRSVSAPTPFASGTAGVVQWSPTTDQIVPGPLGKNNPGSTIDCYPPNMAHQAGAEVIVATTLGLTEANWSALQLDGSQLRFTVPATSYHGPLACCITTPAESAVSACTGFAGCAGYFEQINIEFSATMQ
jgi:hypothetical protein